VKVAPSLNDPIFFFVVWVRFDKHGGLENADMFLSGAALWGNGFIAYCGAFYSKKKLVPGVSIFFKTTRSCVVAMDFNKVWSRTDCIRGRRFIILLRDGRNQPSFVLK
jgi:hypothetical protein